MAAIIANNNIKPAIKKCGRKFEKKARPMVLTFVNELPKSKKPYLLIKIFEKSNKNNVDCLSKCSIISKLKRIKKSKKNRKKTLNKRPNKATFRCVFINSASLIFNIIKTNKKSTATAPT